MIYRCCDRLRSDAVMQNPALTGIDYLEVIDHALPKDDPLRQRTLLVHCLKPLSVAAGDHLDAGNLRLVGGERIKNIAIEWAAPALLPPPQLGAPGEAATAAVIAALEDADKVLVVRVAEAGDFSTYTLSLVTSALDDTPPTDNGLQFDSELAAIGFSFKVECPSDFDCKALRYCPPPLEEPPEVDYLAKDYASLRRLLLDRIAQLAPQWPQTSEADFGIALVELLAYVGDQLSYQQDATATEAYLGTARRRISLRRHALLVDYAMHDGCNARAWVQLQVGPDECQLPLTEISFLTSCPGMPVGIESGSPVLESALHLAPAVFEPLHDPRYAPDYRQPLYKAHNQISFYTWGDRHCCLPQGATSATLLGSFPNLHTGDVLLFEEMLGPQTGEEGDADPSHRHVVRLTKVTPAAVPPAIPPLLTDALTGAEITEIEWAAADALPFPLCISSVTDEAHGSRYLSDVSVARGNLILVDHGQTLPAEPLGTVPPPTLFLSSDCDADFCAPQPPVAIPVRFRPALAHGPLTQAGTAPMADGARLPFDPNLPAADVFDWDMGNVMPQIVLAGTLKGKTVDWQSRRTLLESGADATDFVVEVDDDGIARLRFGNDQYGSRPQTGTAFNAIYRVGNGAAGNVGADTIVHIVGQTADLDNIADVDSPIRNPLAAAGGVDPESSASVRRNAPEAFRTQERAVTPADYAAVTEGFDGVQRAAASLRWTGSWYTVFITVDPAAGFDPAPLKRGLPPFVNAYRMMGQDLEFDDPDYVSLEIALHVCVEPDYFRGDVEAALLEVFGNRRLPDGRKGLFHPDNFSFGETVYLSPVYAAAHAVAGVASVQVTSFRRQGDDDPVPLATGKLPLGRLQIARLDNDPNFPEHGILRLDLHGGK